MFSTNSTKIYSSGKIMHKNNICRILLSKYWCGKESVIAMSKDNTLSHGALLIHCRNNQHDRCDAEWRSLLCFTALNIVWLVDCIKEISSRKLSRFFVKKNCILLFLFLILPLPFFLLSHAISNIYHFILLPPGYMITWCIIGEATKRQKLFSAALSFLIWPVLINIFIIDYWTLGPERLGGYTQFVYYTLHVPG